MQLHRLSLGAIGPFADQCDVDIDRLGASGIFLLEGPTGAGKSTLIDAIVFAIYGTVAGRASSADRMHSDVADADATPFVQLDFSTTQGMYRIRRSPKHERAKRRGEGTTTEHASAKLWRLASPGAAGTDVAEPISTRLDEIGAEITRIVGLTQEQFVQTVVLPQGEFATFLRSTPEVRRELLQRLFGTEIYDVVLDRLVDQRKAARASLASAAAEVVGSVRAYCGAAGLDEEAESLLSDGGKPSETGNIGQTGNKGLTEAIGAHVDQLQGDVDAATAVVGAAAIEVDRVRRHAAECHSRERSRLRVVTLRGELAVLDAAADDHAAMMALLERANDALRLAPILDGLVAAEGRRDAAADVLVERRQRLTDPDAVQQTWPQHERAMRDRAAALASLSDLEQQLPARAAALATLVGDHDDVQRRRRAADEILVLAPGVLADLRQQLTAALTLRGERAGARDDQLAAKDVLVAATRFDTLQERAAQAGAARESARQLAQQCLTDETDIRQRFLDGVAGYIADGLVASEPCPVCGSPEHPRPATRQPGDVDREAVDAAGARLAEATCSLEAASTEVARLESELAELRGRARGVSVADAQLMVVNADLAVADLDIALADVERIETGITDREKSIAENRATSDGLIHEAARLATEVKAAESLVEGDRNRITAAIEGHTSVAERIAALLQDAKQWQSATEAATLAEAVGADLATRDAECREALASAPFNTRDEAAAARLDDQERARLTDELETARRRRTELSAELASPDLVALDVAEVIDVAAADVDCVRAATEQLRAQGMLAQVRQRLEDSRSRAGIIEGALATQARIGATTAPLIRIADLVSGSTADNARAMSLPTFVLRERFADVVASANERLAMMSDGRYALEHVEDREGNKRSGLGLRVRDSHTEQPRDPGTLSGGETFYCSLAMALGLADVVTAEAGGVDLGTLFVDEGFGALDPDTLDNVLSVLSALGTSGRVVGIVSHVPELKERISERITVVLNGDGSSRLAVSA